MRIAAMPSEAILPRAPQITRPWIIAAWILAAAVMFFAIQRTNLTRTQEARVVVAAREMVGQPLERWLIPTANGEARLRKPPLAYWASAGAYEIFGYGVTQARLPALIAAWITLGLTYLIGRRLFNARVGIYSAACLLGSHVFFKHALLAETDVLIMVQMTAAAYFLLRAIDDRKSKKWLYLTAIMIALMTLTKGPPAGYVILMMVMIDITRSKYCVRKKHSESGVLVGDNVVIGDGVNLPPNNISPCLTRRFITSGAVVVAIAIATPWFAYAFSHAEGSQLTDDLGNSVRGGKGHSAHFYAYGPMLLQALLPWSAIWLMSGCASLWFLLHRTWAGRVLHGERQSWWFLYCWGAAILLPLLFWGNKQLQYLVPLMPACMIPVGALIAAAADRLIAEHERVESGIKKATRAILIVIISLIFLAAPVLAIWSQKNGRMPLRDDLLMISAVGALGAILLLAGIMRKTSLPAAAVIAAIGAFTIFLAGWSKNFDGPTPKQMADDLRARFPGGQFVFRNVASLPLCAGFAEVIPVVTDDEIAKANDDTIYIDPIGIQEEIPPGFRVMYGTPRPRSDDDLKLIAIVRDNSRWFSASQSQ